MTVLINRLVKDELVERQRDPADRRIIIVVITEKGKGFVKEWKQGLKRIVGENLSKLSDADIESLHSVFEVIRTIVHKLD